MILTEEEAKTKWCPEVRIGVYNGVSEIAVAVNRSTRDGNEDDCRCRGSDCMMWTWVKHSAERGCCGLTRS